MTTATPQLRPVDSKCIVPSDLWVHAQDDCGRETGYIRRLRYRTPNEIYADIKREMALTVCERCGCEWQRGIRYDEPCPYCGDKEDRHDLVDEYDSCCHFGADADAPILSDEWQMTGIAVYCEPGGNEGDCLRVSILASRGIERQIVDVYHIKSFLGLEHVHGLIARVMKLFGVWPLHEVASEERWRYAPDFPGLRRLTHVERMTIADLRKQGADVTADQAEYHWAQGNYAIASDNEPITGLKRRFARCNKIATGGLNK